MWLGTQRGLEARVVPAAGIDIEWISIRGLRRKGLLALVIADRVGVSHAQIADAMAAFGGTRRRFEVLGQAGGVTVVFEMPNTNPLTTTREALADKVAAARGRMFCDFAFYVGATRENIDEIPTLERLEASAGMKVFMGSSTGNLLVDDEGSLDRIIARLSRRAAFHSEDEDRLIAREGVRRPGDPTSHPEWRDVEAEMISTRRLVALEQLLLDVRFTNSCHQGRQPVFMGEDVIDDGSRHHSSRPSDHHRHPESAFPGGAFLSTEGSRATIGPGDLLRPVVGGVDHDGIVRDAEFVESPTRMLHRLPVGLRAHDDAYLCTHYGSP